jgi:hypothetical protein
MLVGIDWVRMKKNEPGKHSRLTGNVALSGAAKGVAIAV